MIIHGTTNCDKYKSSKVAYIVFKTKDVLTNFSQFWFPDYKGGNIPLRLELI